MQALKINEKLKVLVQTERKVIAEILKLIQILDITKSYRELGGMYSGRRKASVSLYPRLPIYNVRANIF